MSTQINNDNKNINENVNSQEIANLDAKKNELLEIEKRIDTKMSELKSTAENLEQKSKEIENKVQEIKLPEISEKELTKNSLEVKKQLDKLPKKSVRIPIDEKNLDEKFVPVTISGYTYQIERGKSVEVPDEVERILIEAKYI